MRIDKEEINPDIPAWVKHCKQRRMKENLLTILIAHNQLELVKRQIKMLLLFSSIDKRNLIIVDNYSDDGLDEWLKQQENLNYIICDEGLEKYSVILNTIIQEFVTKEDILLLSPQYLPLPKCIENLYDTLHENVNAGAVCADVISFDSPIGKDFANAAAYAEEHQNQRRKSRVICLAEGAVMIRNELLQEKEGFDEQLKLPKNVLRDFAFNKVCANWELFLVENAYVYEMPLIAEDVYLQFFGEDSDRKRLKESWKMNYFNDRPNVGLLTYIERGKEEEFSVLEIGCDCGVNLLHLKNLYKNVVLYGVEMNPMAARIASHIAEVQVVDIEKEALKFDGVKFDYIVFGDVLEHLRDPEAALRYCRKILKKDGKILASIPNLMHYSVLYQLLNGDFTYSDMGLLDRTHVHFFTHNEIIRLFEKEKYKIEKMGYKVLGEVTDEIREFIGKLMEISHNSKEFMFEAFQYNILAVQSDV